MNHPFRTTVLISGSGSNLQAIIDACSSGRLNVEIVHVISNVATARGLERAALAGIPTTVLEHDRFEDRNDFDRALAVLTGADDPDLVVLAGFMRIIGPALLEPFSGRMINLHPSLLPRYRGTDTYQRAIDAGDSQHGASIHFVTAELDGGPVISQVVIPILDDDDKSRLAERLSPMEHRLVVATVEFFSRHRVESSDGQVRIDGKTLAEPLLLQADGRLHAPA
jgi:phosphoribosylglycinamide formyltransferase-1